jgi:hypothetical protein
MKRVKTERPNKRREKERDGERDGEREKGGNAAPVRTKG